MVYGYLLIAVLVIFAVVFFIDKKTFVSWVVKALEIIAVAVLSLGIGFLVGLLFNEASIGVATVGIVFYFFGGLIRPYVQALVEKLTKNFGKKADKKKSK